jgi:hypothetical protein
VLVVLHGHARDSVLSAVQLLVSSEQAAMSIDTRLWASTPFNNPTAWSDFVGTHFLWWQTMKDQIASITGVSVRLYPIGHGGGSAWLNAVQKTYESACNALGIAPPADLESYQLSDPGDFASWCFTISQESRRLALASGLP